MNRCTSLVRSTVLSTFILASAASLAGAATPDAWITTKAKLALLTTEGVSGTKVNVDTIGGQVTLHGSVPTGAEKEKADTVVKGIDGVQGVRNLLQVVAPEEKKAVQASDANIKKAVEQALKADKALADSSISLQSVNNGTVLLAGKAAHLSDQLEAVGTASRVPGVRRVASEIKSADQAGDAPIAREHYASNKGQGLSGAAHDMWITTDVKMRLMADAKAPALDINVDTTAGVVTLFGVVPSAEAKTAAAADARQVSGVKAVRNELQVVPKEAQKAVKARDEDIQSDLTKAFASREDLKDVKATVKNGVAQLNGTVPNGEDRLQAAVVARSTQGVRAVNDHLRISD